MRHRMDLRLPTAVLCVVLAAAVAVMQAGWHLPHFAGPRALSSLYTESGRAATGSAQRHQAPPTSPRDRAPRDRPAAAPTRSPTRSHQSTRSPTRSHQSAANPRPSTAATPPTPLPTSSSLPSPSRSSASDQHMNTTTTPQTLRSSSAPGQHHNTTTGIRALTASAFGQHINTTTALPNLTASASDQHRNARTQLPTATAGSQAGGVATVKKPRAAAAATQRLKEVSRGKYKLTSSDPEAATATTLLVMSDSRPPGAPGYQSATFRINARYAAKHPNTSIIFVHTPCAAGHAVSPKSCVACSHRVHGGRAAPWCKLAALSAAMEMYPNVTRFVYIDSDAFVNTMAPLPSKYFNATLNVFYNFPWVGAAPACAGIMFWNAGPDAGRVLQEWWDQPPPQKTHNMAHDFEQSVFRTEFWKRNNASIHVIREKTMVSEANQTFQHIGHNRAPKRETLMNEALLALVLH